MSNKPEICQPNRYDTLIDTQYQCIVCCNTVGSERHEVRLSDGTLHVYYDPASRYFCLAGVFCSIECSFTYYELHQRP